MIHSLKILAVDLPHVAMEVVCSKGTYIRSLAADLGRKLGAGGHLTALRRIASGPFRAQNALSSRALSGVPCETILRARAIPLRDALPNMREIEVDGSLAERVRRGYQPGWDEAARDLDPRDPKEGYVKFVHGSELVAIGNVQRAGEGSKRSLKIERVFTRTFGLI